ncbi:MAG: hypothetical protein JWO38_7049 [Gemmataceae bacterium]|nr:hypothetical protein [Gemmataceae bacterium]
MARGPNDRTHRDSVPSIPAHQAYSRRPSSPSMNERISRSAAYGAFSCRPYLAALEPPGPVALRAGERPTGVCWADDSGTPQGRRAALVVR